MRRRAGCTGKLPYGGEDGGIKTNTSTIFSWHQKNADTHSYQAGE